MEGGTAAVVRAPPPPRRAGSPRPPPCATNAGCRAGWTEDAAGSSCGDLQGESTQRELSWRWTDFRSIKAF